MIGNVTLVSYHKFTMTTVTLPIQGPMSCQVSKAIDKIWCFGMVHGILWDIVVLKCEFITIGDVEGILKVKSPNTCYRFCTWARLVRLPSLNVTENLWWWINIGYGYGLVPSCNKPLLALMFTQTQAENLIFLSYASWKFVTWLGRSANFPTRNSIHSSLPWYKILWAKILNAILYKCNLDHAVKLFLLKRPKSMICHLLCN